jgi:hypothetical protein
MAWRPESHKSSPDTDPRVDAGKEIKWVYATSLPHEEGRPNVELVLGIPQDADWLRPEVDNPTAYLYRLPLNVVAGSENSQMLVEGSISAVSPDNIVFKHLSLSQMPSDASKAWAENYQRISDHLTETLCEAVMDQCKTYLTTYDGAAAGP